MVRKNLRFATGTRLPSIRLPALQKARSEIFRPCRCPAVDNRRREKCALLDFRLVWYDIARSDASVQADKLLFGLLGGWKFCNLLKRHIYASFLLQFASRRVIITFSGGHVARSARVPLQRMPIFPARALLQINVTRLVKYQDVNGPMAQV